MLNRRSPLLWLAVAFVLHMGSSLVVAWWLVHVHPELTEALIEATLAAAGLAVLTYATVYKILELRVFKKAAKMAVQIRAIAHGDRGTIDAHKFTALDPLPAAVNVLGGKFTEARNQMRDQVHNATARVEEEKGRLAAILNDLAEGVVVCNLNHQIVLYNQVALKLLHVTGELGLGRSLFGMLSRDPVMHIFDKLAKHAQARAVPFLAPTTDGKALLQARMTLIRGKDEQATAYVVSLTDATEQLGALSKRDALLREVTDSIQAPLGTLKAELPDNPALAAIAQTVSNVTNAWRQVATGWWPMADVHSPDLIEYVISRLQDCGANVTMTGLPVWLHGDSYSLALAVEAVIRAIRDDEAVRDFDLEVEATGSHTWINVLWAAEGLDPAKVERWLTQPLGPALGGLTVRDVLQHHTLEGAGIDLVEGRAKLHLPLLPAREAHDTDGSALPPRPEFFDFDLLAQDKAVAAGLGQKRLRDLTFVVFDTETTGLAPSQGDQIVQIAGVRIVNGRILTGESFDRIVNPGRRIPPESIKFHGITDEIAKDKPPLSVVLPQFKAFAADAVLVAHNAAFDLKFIRMRERECGVKFDNPVLDTMLLSSYVDGTPENQSLDAIADRYGVTIHDRHTALGDSLCTAVVLLKLIEGLEEKGIHTLDEAVKTLNMTVELHQRAAAL